MYIVGSLQIPLVSLDPLCIKYMNSIITISKTGIKRELLSIQEDITNSADGT
jgi:hypothetical protein